MLSRFLATYPCENLLTHRVAEGTGAGDWTSAYQKAKAFVAKLSDDEKVNLTAGVSSDNGCSGNIQSIPRLGFPGICVSDAGNGLVSTF
jgi:beta-glucosidase